MDALGQKLKFGRDERLQTVQSALLLWTVRGKLAKLREIAPHLARAAVIRRQVASLPGEQKALLASGCQVVTVAVRRERLLDTNGRSLLDFLDAERSYRATELAYRQSLAGYMSALEQLRQAVGTRSLP